MPGPASRAHAPRALSRRLAPALALALVTLGAAGCTSPGARFFRPPHELPQVAPLTSESPTLTLIATAAGQHLGDRLMWRRSEVELGFSDQERWTQPPARYVDRALSDALFVQRGLRRVERGAPALAVELVAFEEVLLPEHVARVELRVLLLDAEGAALFERSVASSRPVAREQAEAAAEALGAALDAVAQELAEAVQAALRGA